MPRKKSTVTIQVDAVRLSNPIEKWRKNEGLSAPEIARELGYTTVGGYHRLARCEIVPLLKLKKFADLSGLSLDSVLAYFQKNQRRAA